MRAGRGGGKRCGRAMAWKQSRGADVGGWRIGCGSAVVELEVSKQGGRCGHHRLGCSVMVMGSGVCV